MIEAGLPLTFTAVAERVPGPRWAALSAATWPAYRRWWLRDGAAARPGPHVGARMLDRHMPELLPTWRRLVDLAGEALVTGESALAASLLALYDPPPTFVACSQSVVRGTRPALVRNYDYDPALLERVVFASAFTGRRVIGTSDCLWGVLDGMNADGLVVSLAFGGRPVVGSGFGIQLVVRYLLDTCATVADARRALRRLPVQLAYNLTMLDRAGTAGTMLMGPGRPPRWVDWHVATNHQDEPEWPEFVVAARSVERAERLARLLVEAGGDVDAVVRGFLRAPLYHPSRGTGFSTLYTVVYRPVEGTVEYHWPGSVWRHSIDALGPPQHHVVIRTPVAASSIPRDSWLS